MPKSLLGASPGSDFSVPNTKTKPALTRPSFPNPDRRRNRLRLPNALSGSLAYARAKRIDYKSGIVFSIAAVPGALLGAFTTTFIPRRNFDALFGTLMICVSALLFLRPGKKGPGLATSVASLAQGGTKEPNSSGVSRGKLLLGAGFSGVLGYLSSFFGIGAGFIPAR